MTANRGHMEIGTTARRTIATVAMLAIALLAGCMLAPGKFTADLDIRKDGRFTFHYQGEIRVLALSDFATKGGQKEAFSPSPCSDTDEDGNSVERDCSKEELASQKADWEEQQAAAQSKRKQEAEQMRAVMGGLDPGDPKAAEELAARLRRQAGFRTVEYKGDGLYLVDYLATSSLTHGFSFPVVEGFPMANAFIVIAPRNDGGVRIDAPGFGPSPGANPASAMMIGAMQSGNGAEPKMPLPEGVFTLTTDARVLSNNTDEGPQRVPDGQRLVWKVSPGSTSAPMALLKLDAR